MPGALVPQFVKVGDFWVPDEWKLRADAVEDVQACRVRRSIVRRRPPIDFESLLELGELFGVNPVDGAEPHLFHVRVAGSEYCYAPETRVARGPAGEALIRLDVPGGILLVPRRHPRKPPPGARPDLRDWVEVVCVFDHEGLFHAAPLADGWRFALVWGPSVPALEPLLRAMHAQDAGFLTLQRDPDAPRRFEEPLDFVLPSDDAATYLDALYRLARDGILSVAHLDPTRRPQPVLRIYPGASAYVAELWFQYDRLLVPPFDVPHSAETGSRERFVVRHFATEESALETIVGLFGEPDEPGTWLLTPRRVEGHRSALGTLQREHGWQVEVAYEPTSRGRRKRRATGLKSEPVFRKLADEPLDREGELAYQRYSERALALAAEEADEIARALAESARPDDAFPDGDVGPDADADETAFPPEAAKPERRLPLVDLRRSIEHFVVGQQFHLLAQRMRKVTELRRLQATERQSSETLAQALAFAEGMVTQAGHRVKAHQRDALRGVLHRLWAGEGAILALPVGYGKTLVALLVAVTLQRLGVVQSPVLWIGTKSTLVSLRGDLEKFMPALRVNDYTGPRRQQTFVGMDL
ncbi:MAG: hypothetical protein FJ090_22495, partial [Deltaproteobacteria bacterium]|nr:hypothetical protein [Deltaproteobacteria bacterium]